MPNTAYIELVEPASWVKVREHETKVGQAIHCLDAREEYRERLQQAWDDGQRVAVIGIPESIGVRGNLGRPGAEGGWDAFLASFLNLQKTALFSTDELLLVGAVDCSDLNGQAAKLDANNEHELSQLRQLCGQLDARVIDVITPLFEQGFEVITIGGGHNNAYPLLTALHRTTQQQVGATNLDPHADFRAMEGRHSGNGFSYAYMEGALAFYHVVGLHPGKNSASSLKQLSDAGMRYHAMQQLFERPFTEVVAEAVAKADSWQCPLGIEVDVDALTGVPASAINYSGLTLPQGFLYVKGLAEVSTTRYLHLAEAAPALSSAGAEEGAKQAGQVLSELTIGYLQGRRKRR